MPSVAIIGAGFGGLCMAIRLQMAGTATYTVFEKAGDIGGTWRDNTYPGAGCDIPSHLYSYSFEKYASWTRRYPDQPEILAYLERCADKYGVRPRIRLNTEVIAAEFTGERWRVTTNAGDVEEFDVLVAGVGQLNRPRLPDIEGMAEFTGTSLPFRPVEPLPRSHRPRRGRDRQRLVGRPVHPPDRAEVARRVDVFQRTPNWVIPKPDAGFTLPHRLAFRYLPFLQRAYREWIYRRGGGHVLPGAAQERLEHRILRGLALKHLRDQVPDPELRARLTPGYPIGCKRILLDNAFYPALTRPNVEVVTDPITRITPRGVETATGYRGRHDRLRHRLPDLRLPRAHRDHRPCGPYARRGSGRTGRRGVSGDHGAGLPQPLHAVRAQHQPRPQLDRLHDRMSGRYIMGLPAVHRGARSMEVGRTRWTPGGGGWSGRWARWSGRTGCRAGTRTPAAR